MEVTLAVKQSSAAKRHRQSEVRRLRNKAVKSAARTYAKKYGAAVQAKDPAGALEALRVLQKTLDTACGKGIISKNAAGRKKSRAMKLYHTSFETVSV
ncbi:MAG: 30S ribosomal protein S20 [Spirochaetaceae bacterium]|jgi:small subunit ribosomal protein S20|nr:30S ribosomal protein S20 [Spirochaetaceae bacterium]